MFWTTGRLGGVLWGLEAYDFAVHRSKLQQVAWRTWGQGVRNPVAVLCLGLLAGRLGTCGAWREVEYIQQ